METESSTINTFRKSLPLWKTSRNGLSRSQSQASAAMGGLRSAAPAASRSSGTVEPLQFLSAATSKRVRLTQKRFLRENWGRAPSRCALSGRDRAHFCDLLHLLQCAMDCL
jgi:hypothetical protein